MEPLLAALERPLMNRWFFYFNAAQVRSKESGVRSRESTAPPSELIQSIRVYLCYPWPAFLYFLCLFVYFVANPFCRRQKNPCISVLPACRQAGPWPAFLYFLCLFVYFVDPHSFCRMAENDLLYSIRVNLCYLPACPLSIVDLRVDTEL